MKYLDPYHIRLFLSTFVPHNTFQSLTAKFPKILMYHSIVSDKSRLHVLFPGKYISLAEFDQQMRYIRTYFTPVSLRRTIQNIRDGINFAPKSVCVTFDDGYSNNFYLALPILQRYEIPATVFPVTGFIDDQLVFWTDIVDTFFLRYDGDEVDIPFLGKKVWTNNLSSRKEGAAHVKRYIKTLGTLGPAFDEAVGWLDKKIRKHSMGEEHLPMSWDNLRAWQRSGHDVGAHTVSHPILSSISLCEAKKEIISSKARLESELPGPIDLFAYPYGNKNDFLEALQHFLESQGFIGAVSTIPGLVRLDRGLLFSLRRYEAKQDFRDFVAHVSGFQYILSKFLRKEGG